MYTEPGDNLEENQHSGDPFALSSGSIIYSRRHKMNILISDKPGVVQKLPSQEELLVKVAIQGHTENLRLVSIELTSDSELEFNFQFRCNDMDFRRIKQIQKFYIQFREYPDAIVKNLQRLSAKNNNQNYQANFTIFSEMEGKLDIIRKSQFKDDLIMQFSFGKSAEDHIEASVQHRYDLMRRQYAGKVKKFEEYRQIVRAKNPSLIMQIDKALKLKK